MRVFVAGPRAVNNLNTDITEVLTRIIDKRLDVLVGDADGVDCLAQKFFAEAKYPNVTVYASNGKTRNNIGGWNTLNVEVPANIKGFDFYAQKDIRMAQDADCGFMVWNGKSKGTFNNIINLTSQYKKTMIYFIAAKKTLCIEKLEEIGIIAEYMYPDVLAQYHLLCQKKVYASKSESFEQLSLPELFL